MHRHSSISRAPGRRALPTAVLVAVLAGLAAVPGLATPTATGAAPSGGEGAGDQDLPAGALAAVGGTQTPRVSPYAGTPYSESAALYVYDEAGRLGTVVVDKAARRLTVQGYDPETFEPVGAARRIDYDWPAFGSFYAAPDGTFFLLTGRNNPSQVDDRAVVSVRRFDADLNPTGEAFLRGDAEQGFAGVVEPFASSEPGVLQVGDRLVVHMARDMYADGNGVNHQENLTFEVDLDTMTTRTFQQAGIGLNVSSHSFHQLVARSGDDLVLADHGDAFPRAVTLGVTDDYATGGDQTVVHRLLDIGGDWVEDGNTTETTVTGLVAGAVDGQERALVVGTALPNGHPVGGVSGWQQGWKQNVYAVSVPTDLPPDPEQGEQGDFSWLTTFSPTGSSTVSDPRLVAVGADRFALMYGVRDRSGHRLEYRLLDAAGTVHASETFPDTWFSPASQPVLLGDRLLWLGHDVDGATHSAPVPVYLYGLDVADTSDPAALVPGQPGDPSDDASLADLTSAGGALRPGFAPSTTAYRIRLPRSTPRVRLRWRATDDGAMALVRLDGGPWRDTGTVRVAVQPGATRTAQVLVTAEDGATTRAYEVRVTRRR